MQDAVSTLSLSRAWMLATRLCKSQERVTSAVQLREDTVLQSLVGTLTVITFSSPAHLSRTGFIVIRCKDCMAFPWVRYVLGMKNTSIFQSSWRTIRCQGSSQNEIWQCCQVAQHRMGGASRLRIHACEFRAYVLHCTVWCYDILYSNISWFILILQYITACSFVSYDTILQYSVLYYIRLYLSISWFAMPH